MASRKGGAEAVHQAKQADAEAGRVAATEFKRTKCPITREQFAEDAKPLSLVVNGQQLALSVQSQKDGTVGFATGSLGWRNGDKVTVMIGDVPCKVQLNISAIVVGSKDLPS